MLLVAEPLELKATFAELFQRCANEPWALFLDSCDNSSSEWDFIFRQPESVVTEPQHWPQQLEQLLAQIPPYQGPTELPFQGGLAGAWSYDAGRTLETLPSQAQADIDLPDLAVGCYTQALMRHRKSGATWLLAPQHRLAELKDYWLAPAHNQSGKPFKLLTPWQSNMMAVDYADNFARVQAYLNAGDCYQINLAQRFSALYQGDLWPAYEQLREANNAPFSAFFNLAKGSLLSLSPERFIAIAASGKVESKPIKGTRPRSPDSEIDEELAAELAQSSKDRAENVMIVDLLRNDLSRLCQPHSVKVPKLFAVESYPAVHHLVSTVVGQLQSKQQNLALFSACFPGGSITGAPKIRAMEIIDELEPHRRSYYCGSFGYFSQHGQADTNIAIRTLVASVSADKTGQLHCWAGGGLVADSECASEYQETLDKVARILPLLTQLNTVE